MRKLARLLSQRMWTIPALAVALLCALIAPDVQRVSAKKDRRAGGKTTATRAIGPSTQSVSPDPSISGKWVLQSNGTFVDPWPMTPVHINLLPNGKLLFWGRDKSADSQGWDIEGSSMARVWDPFYKDFAMVNNTRTNLFCSSHSFLPDGRLLVAGGHEVLEANRAVEGLGSKHTNIFDYRDNTWRPGPDMNLGRWYPFNVTLGTGETAIVSGSYLRTENPVTVRQNTIPQVFTAQESLRDLVAMNVNRGPIENSPQLHLMPNGNVLVAADEFNTKTAFMNAAGSGFWVLGDFLRSPHEFPTSVTYDQNGKVLVVGGRSGTLASNVAEVFDINDFDQSNPKLWKSTTSMIYPRMHHTATLLPDGKVLVTGGTTCPGTNEINCATGAAMNPELWNPLDGLWTEMKAHQEVRVYHSTAILLPDARVLVGGGGLPGATGEPWTDEPGRRTFEHNNVEIFEPPYLFVPGGGEAIRPAITSAPKEVTYGQSFTVGVGTVAANEIEAAVLIRLGAVTHGFNQDQRRVPLSVTPSADGLSLSLVAPTNPNQCPPGHYMLFLLKRNGASLTPSVAKIIRVNKISPSSNLQVLSSTAQTRSVSITATPATPWSVTVPSGSDFITIVGPSGQTTGSGTLTFSVAANGAGVRRTGKILISVPGQGVVFNQEILVHQGKLFTDVPVDASLDPASKINAMGITAGCGGTLFCSDRLINRGEISVFFVTAALGPGISPPVPATQRFMDVAPTHDYYRFIEDFAKRGFTAGCGGGNFCPTRNVTRAELAAFLVGALGVKARTTATQTFSDVMIGETFHKVIEEVAARGLMTGCDSQRFCPTDKVTRFEVAQALAKAYGF